MNSPINNLTNFKRRAIKELVLTEQIQSWSFKELGDHLIQEIWSKEEFDSKNAVVLSRVINILFKIQENKDNKNKCQKS